MPTLALYANSPDTIKCTNLSNICNGVGITGLWKN